MLYNSLAIITLGYLEDMSYDYILSKLQTFKGTKRRYTVKLKETMFLLTIMHIIQLQSDMLLKQQE